METKKHVTACLLIGLLSIAYLPNAARASEQSGKKKMKVEITEGQIDVISNIIYSQVTLRNANRPLKMTLLVPRTQEAKPAIVYYPGGGFTSANHEKFIEMRMALAKAGFVVAAAEYRTVPDRYPALINDAKAAVRYLRAHARKFGIDPQRIGVIGDSAGGYVAQMMGTTNGEKQFDTGDFTEVSSDVQAAVTIYGISNLMNIGEGYPEAIQEVHKSPAVTEALLIHGPAFADFAGESILSDPQKALEASPIGHIKQGMPPFLIMHGSADKLVSPIQSEQLYRALTEKGNQADYIEVEGAGHGDLYWFQPAIIDTVVRWFKEHL
ncbi:MAG TPA: alpha/beta hydrolase [Mediterranea massiliensis]|mgnify:FL=1|uniref:Alpha/beta hydrolase n=1 Tax=Mediterranea massiliensis TaxID=1841865 RepID=A0A921HYS7_9BACT|nr:alpha/beta hydrolase [Mediterranea massiliensis]MBM6735700.1 alpha/beta hydrolase [Mediterranea massiliensis]CCZ48729.1 alpha/beta hydrolase fold-3 domain-containing protein [Bacteroides sp. CAG:661]HJF92849.1 alpha/beta hydrolase [Mediterranea massiliensis]